jgi:D-alanyl-lipoteichoic acid acyltransferase DltB (MBOAT superfamily)
MLFNSFEFLVFLPIVFVVYWYLLAEHRRLQNIFLVVVSYIFYGWWDYRFLSLIILSSFIDFFIANRMTIAKSKSNRKQLLIISLIVNLGMLGFFKYYNFFVESFIDSFSFTGLNLHVSTLSIILPVGISFYTFQTLSYTIDVYRNKLNPTKDIVAFFAFVSFFPQLVAGPIERAANLLPQFYKKRNFSLPLATDGMRQILWGFFKKIVIADNCAIYVNDIFSNSADYSGSTLLLGGFLFAFQIYGDFSGYSDIAIGTARLFGFNLMKNFNFPYFSRDIAEFWRKWHISLSTWFRDYVYIPLGGSKVSSTYLKLRNVFIIFLVSGFWHGANWTFVAWGAFNAALFIPLMLTKRNRNNLNRKEDNHLIPSLKEIFQILLTFFLTTIAWIFFRADTITHALDILYEIFSISLINKFEVFPLKVLLIIICFIVFEWIQKMKEHGLQIDHWHYIFRWSSYVFLSIIIISMFGSKNTFIYFQF